jgi:hypothetical protein
MYERKTIFSPVLFFLEILKNPRVFEFTIILLVDQSALDQSQRSTNPRWPISDDQSALICQPIRMMESSRSPPHKVENLNKVYYGLSRRTVSWLASQLEYSMPQPTCPYNLPNPQNLLSSAEFLNYSLAPPPPQKSFVSSSIQFLLLTWPMFLCISSHVIDQALGPGPSWSTADRLPMIRDAQKLEKRDWKG